MNWETKEFLRDVARAIVVIFITIFVLLFLFGRAGAQEPHMHGSVQADANWFDEGCCHSEDCKRIDADEVTRDGDKYIWRSKRSGKLHVIHKDARLNWKRGEPGEDNGPRIRLSQDGYHYGCEYPIRDEAGVLRDWLARCLYLPIMG